MPPSAEFLAQHAALTRGAGFAVLTARTLLEIRGSDRTSFLHAFCTNDIKALQPGQGCEAFITSPQGKTLVHVFVLCEPDRLLLDTVPGQARDLVVHFDRYVLSEDVQFIDRTAETSTLVLAGQLGGDVLRQVGVSELPAAMLQHGPALIDGLKVIIARVPFLADAYSLLCEAGDAARLQAALVQHGAVACSAEAFDAARLEAGFPLFGADITADNLPQEVGRDAAAISFTKGCYLGQETVARIDAMGHVNRKLVGLKFTGDAVPAAGTPLFSGDKEVGRVTSAAWSPLLGAPLALACVRTQHARPGGQLAAGAAAAEVVKLPVSPR